MINKHKQDIKQLQVEIDKVTLDYHAKIQELKATKKRAKSIVKVMKKYPDYDHKKMIDFYNKHLTKEQQQEIHKDSKSYAKVYKKVYHIYKGVKSVINIKTMKGDIKL